MLAKVVRLDGLEVTFAYDALGRRIWKKAGRATTRFVWDGDVLLHEWKSVEGRAPDPDDVVTWLFEPGGFVPAAKLKGDRQYSVLADHLGTPTRIHDAEGGLVWHMTLDAYGRETCLKGEAGACPFRYQGQYADPETGVCTTTASATTTPPTGGTFPRTPSAWPAGSWGCTTWKTMSVSAALAPGAGARTAAMRLAMGGAWGTSCVGA